MSVLDRIRDGFKYLDKNGLKHLVEKIKAHDVHWTGTHAEYEVQKDTIPAYAILHFTDDYDENVKVGIYSTEETKTGELFLNKPVYRKVFVDTIGVTAGGNRALATGIQAGVVDDVIKLNTILKCVADRTYWWGTDWVAPASSSVPVATVNVYLNTNGTALDITNNGNWPETSRMIVILEYTKTTN